MTESHVYVFVRQDIPLEHQFIQSNHAVLHLALKHTGIVGVPNIVGIGVPNLKSLHKVKAKLEENFITHLCWSEPDNDLGFTAVATVPLCGKIREVLSNYRLWKHAPQLVRRISECASASKAEGVGLSPTGPTNLTSQMI